MPPACGLRGGGSGAGAALGRGAPSPSPSCGLQNWRRGSAPWGARICSGGSRSRNPRLAAGTRCQLTGTPSTAPRSAAPLGNVTTTPCLLLPAPLHRDEGSSTSPPRSHVRASQTSPFQPFLQNPEPTKILFPPVFWSPVRVRGGRDADPSTCPMSCCSFYRNWGIFEGVPARENSVVLKGGEGRRARYLLLLAWLPLPLIGADATGDGKQRAGGNIARRNSGSAALKAKAQSKNAPKRCPKRRSLLLSLRGRLGRAARSAQGKNLSFFSFNSGSSLEFWVFFWQGASCLLCSQASKLQPYFRQGTKPLGDLGHPWSEPCRRQMGWRLSKAERGRRDEPHPRLFPAPNRC